MSDMLGPNLSPAMVKAVAKVAEECLGRQHAVTKAFGAALTCPDPTLIEMARTLFDELPAGKRNMIWLAAKSRIARAKRVPVKTSNLPYTAADLSPKRVLH